MEITVGEIITAQAALEKVLDKDLPVKASYRLSRLNEKLLPIKQQFEKSRNSLVINKYGEEIEDQKGAFKVKEDKIEAYTKEVADLFTMKEEVEFTPFSIEDFGTTLALPPQFFSDIKSFMKEE